ncbi:hypothetical protein GC163_11950 [bacterium]|nr:hypothetical protein [bacterium]
MILCWSRWMGCLLVIGCGLPMVSADEPLPVKDPPATADSAIKPPKSEPGAIDARLEKLTEKMQQASTQLSEKQTGLDTQELQRKIIQELDDLLKQPPPQKSSNSQNNSSSSNGQSGSSGQPSQRKTSSSSKPSQSSQQNAAGKESSSAAVPGEMQNRTQAEDSEERTGPTRDVPVATLPRRRLEVDVWGHLPDKVREQLLNAYGERMVPQYEDLVQRFYRSLADTAEKK